MSKKCCIFGGRNALPTFRLCIIETIGLRYRSKINVMIGLGIGCIIAGIVVFYAGGAEQNLITGIIGGILEIAGIVMCFM